MTTTNLTKRDDWKAVRAACRGQRPWLSTLALVIDDGWTAAEFTEYARSCHRRQNRDHATSYSFRRALGNAQGSTALLWRSEFRARGSVPLPPRCAEELSYAPGATGISEWCRWWPWHGPELVALIDQRARDHLGLSSDAAVSPGAWNVAYREYAKQRDAGAEPSTPTPKAPKRATA